MKLLVGLGNPGSRYDLTRHNAGFVILDLIAEKFGLTWEDATSKFDGYVARGRVLDEQAVLLKPQTFMNLSGRSAQKVMQFYKIEPTELVVLHDDIDVPSGKVKAREGGGHGGNNGVRNIIEVTGEAGFARIKLGIGKPPTVRELHGPGGEHLPDKPIAEVRDWVLQKFTPTELEALKGAMLTETLTRLQGIFKQRASGR